MPYALKSPKGKIHWETICSHKDDPWDCGRNYKVTNLASEEKGWKSVKVEVVEVTPKKKGGK